MNEERKALMTKISEFRQELRACDWTPDKAFQLNGQTKYRYVSAEKVKRNVNQILPKHGLEMKVDYDDLQGRAGIGMMSQHWTVRATMTITDIDTGAIERYTAYGEAGDSGDKAIGKTLTHGFKQLVFQNFLVADNADPEGEDVSTAVPIQRRAPPADAKTTMPKVMEHAVKPTPKAPQTPVRPPVTPRASPSAPSAVQKKALESITARIAERYADGEMTEDEVKKAMDEIEGVKTSADAFAVIGRYQDGPQV